MGWGKSLRLVAGSITNLADSINNLNKNSSNNSTQNLSNNSSQDSIYKNITFYGLLFIVVCVIINYLKKYILWYKKIIIK